MLALPLLCVALTSFAIAQGTTRKESDEPAKAEVLN
jgi:hypothetical protein